MLSVQHRKEVTIMGRLLSPSWWVSMLVSTFFTMLFIWIIKKASASVNIPVVSTIASEV